MQVAIAKWITGIHTASRRRRFDSCRVVIPLTRPFIFPSVRRRRHQSQRSPVFSFRSCPMAPGFSLRRPLYVPTQHFILIRSDFCSRRYFGSRNQRAGRRKIVMKEGVKRQATAKRKQGCVRRRTRRRVQSASSAIQRLFLACKAVFKGPGTVPGPADVRKLRLILDKMGPEDIGLSTDILFFRDGDHISNRTSRIAYATIYNCDNFSICVFFLPRAAVIPLHDHPGMTVFSKLLLGTMHIKSYDWLDPVTSSDRYMRPAELIVDSDFTAPCKASVLYPATGGNIHAFTAITPCVVLDVLGPPYTKEDGRDITYYRDYYSNNSRVGWLEEVDISKDLKMDGVEYLGPHVIDGQ
ncbi:hypothetical protein ZIOFF_011128 [Zingiber officinale]|uniref:cysteine dioxygenase n=2 Tax=Zingiber officinale TaxID=94328 RepID=A0A8J5I5A8_ZINOF|nr:hypothetical protein ZIOFF_011128 [Zingiber officinale]